MATAERRQRWAAFSVRAHRDLGSLASDLLLYERLVLPVPADETEFERWQSHGWDPELVALRKVQAGGLIYTASWTAELRQEHADQMYLQGLSGEIGYGMTAGLLTGERAWSEIIAGLDEDQVPEERPFLIAAYQSEREAEAALRLRPDAPPAPPGGRPEDEVLALRVDEILDEPAHDDPDEAFLTAVALADDPDFREARRALFSFVDDLVTDQRSPAEIATRLADLEADYNEAVRQFRARTRKRRAVTLLPKVVGLGANYAGVPFARQGGGVLSKVAGRFVRAPEEPGRAGEALAMIRAAFRERALC